LSQGAIMEWKPFPEGTRVKHRDEGYQGWVDGLTQVHEGGKVNPDGKSKYRIRVHGHEKRRLAAELEIADCKDIESIFRSTEDLLQKRIEKQGKEKPEKERLDHWNRLIPLPCTIWALGEYHPERDQKGNLIVNRGNHTHHILRLKKEGPSDVLNYFYEKLDKILAEESTIAMIPSSIPSSLNHGLKDVIRRLAQNRRVDSSSSLLRHQPILPSQSASYYRLNREDINRHLDSIKVIDSSLIWYRVVLLMDDIATTGTSFMGCRKLLLDAGASEVVCLALGVTARLVKKG